MQELADLVNPTTEPKAKKKAKPKAPAEPKPVYLTYEDFEYEDLLTYAGLDCIVTTELASRVAPLIFDEPIYTFPEGEKLTPTKRKIMSIADSYEKFVEPAFEFVVDLEINGIKYDVDLNRRFNQSMVNDIGLLEDRIFSAIGRSINLDSGDVLKKLLYEEKGYEVRNTTKKGDPATDGEALLDLAEHTGEAWLSDLAKRNDIASSWRTFIRSYVSDFVKRDGRLHPSYNLHGTSSFRISGENPNLTQLPRPKHGYNLRQCYTVDDGYVFIALDFSSAEVKVLGAMSKDPSLLKAIADGMDFHSYSAARLNGIPYDEFVAILADKTNPLAKKYKQMRQTAKGLTFGVLYGSTANGVALNLGISLAQAEELIRLYFDNFPKIKDYIERTHLMSKWNHYLVSPFGQRKMQYGTLPVFERTAVYNAALRNSQNVL